MFSVPSTNSDLQEDEDVQEVFSARLFGHFEPKSWLFKKASPSLVFGEYKTQLFALSCVLYL